MATDSEDLHLVSNLKKSFIWNTLASITYACMSFLWLIFVVRFCGSEVGGMFSITFSIAQTVQAIGYFGMRNYQVTDLSKTFSFAQYNASRIVTVLVMVICSVFIAIFSNYRGDKLFIFCMFIFIKVIESIADVYEGAIQQHNRMDVSAKCLFFRTLITIALFITVIVLTQNIVLASFIAAIVSLISFCIFTLTAVRNYEKIKFNFTNVQKILVQCFPLFVCMAGILIINNSPKIVIDSLMDYESQAIFNIIFIPTFVINLISGFIFRPMLHSMATMAQNYEIKKLESLIGKLMLMIIGIIIVMIVSAYFLAVPILNLIYGVDIGQYKMLIIVVIIAGGFVAGINLLNQILTTLRKQVVMMIVNLLGVVISFPLSQALVSLYGLSGGVFAFTLSMIFCFISLWIGYVYSKNKSISSNEE